MEMLLCGLSCTVSSNAQRCYEQQSKRKATFSGLWFSLFFLQPWCRHRSGRSSDPLRGCDWCQPSRVVMEQGCQWGMLTKCRKLFSWRGFQPLDWGEIAFSALWVLGSASLEFPLSEKWLANVNDKSTKVVAVFLKCSPLFIARPLSINVESAVQPGPPLSSSVDG